jgi:hypothetical protein
MNRPMFILALYGSIILVIEQMIAYSTALHVMYFVGWWWVFEFIQQTLQKYQINDQRGRLWITWTSRWCPSPNDTLLMGGYKFWLYIHLFTLHFSLCFLFTGSTHYLYEWVRFILTDVTMFLLVQS